MLPAWTNKILLPSNDQHQENNQEQYDRKVYTEQVDNVLPQQSFAIQSNPSDFTLDRYISGDILIMSQERLVPPQVMKIGLFSCLAANHTDQNRTLSILNLNSIDQKQQSIKQPNRICYQNAHQQSLAMRSKRQHHFYSKTGQSIDKQMLLNYEAFQKLQISSQFPRKHKKVIKLKGKSYTQHQPFKQSLQLTTSYTKLCRTMFQSVLHNYGRTLMTEYSRNRFLHVTLNNSQFPHRLNTQILITPAKNHHKSIDRVVTIFKTEGDRSLQPTTASKNKHGIRVLTKSKERDSSIQSSGNRYSHESRLIGRKLFEKNDQLSKQRKLTCCPSSGDLKSMTASPCYFENRAHRNKEIKPINQLVYKYPKPIRLFHKQQSHTHKFQVS